MRPCVGLWPNIPQKAAGSRTDPPPSVPVASAHIPEATLAPAPPLDPPVVRPGSQGLLAAGKIFVNVSSLLPNSGVFVLPRMTAPDLRTRSATTESKSGTQSL